MSESKENFSNLAQKINKIPSRIQVLKEYVASLFGIKIIDQKFLSSLQNIEKTREKFDNILNK